MFGLDYLIKHPVADRFKVTIYNKALIAFPHIPIIERFILINITFTIRYINTFDDINRFDFYLFMNA